MKKCALLFCLLAIVSMAVNCGGNRRWTAEQHKDFDAKCSQTVTVSSLMVNFRGFADGEFSAVTVKEFNGAKLIDTFKVAVPPAQGQWEKDNKSRSATIQRTININNSYEFTVPGQKAYKLANMKMIKWAQYTMHSEGWGCVMGDFTIDGVRFEHDSSPSFKKRP